MVARGGHGRVHGIGGEQAAARSTDVLLVRVGGVVVGGGEALVRIVKRNDAHATLVITRIERRRNPLRAAASIACRAHGHDPRTARAVGHIEERLVLFVEVLDRGSQRDVGHAHVVARGAGHAAVLGKQPVIAVDQLGGTRPAIAVEDLEADEARPIARARDADAVVGNGRDQAAHVGAVTVARLAELAVVRDVCVVFGDVPIRQHVGLQVRMVHVEALVYDGHGGTLGQGRQVTCELPGLRGRNGVQVRLVVAIGVARGLRRQRAGQPARHTAPELRARQAFVRKRSRGIEVVGLGYLDARVGRERGAHGIHVHAIGEPQDRGAHPVAAQRHRALQAGHAGHLAEARDVLGRGPLAQDDHELSFNVRARGLFGRGCRDLCQSWRSGAERTPQSQQRRQYPRAEPTMLHVRPPIINCLSVNAGSPRTPEPIRHTSHLQCQRPAPHELPIPIYTKDAPRCDHRTHRDGLRAPRRGASGAPPCWQAPVGKSTLNDGNQSLNENKSP